MSRPRPTGLPAWLAPLLLVGLPALAAAATAAVWAQNDAIFAVSDSGHHHAMVLVYSRLFALATATDLLEIVRNSHILWPPLPFFYFGIVGSLLGDSWGVLRVAGVTLLPLLLWAVYRLGCRAGDRHVGVLAAVLTATSFGAHCAMSQILTDYIGLVMVTLAVLALLHPDALKKPGRAVALGAICGVALLSRFQVVFFLAAPAAAVLVWWLVRADSWRARGRIALLTLLSLAVATAISAIHWGGHGRLQQLLDMSSLHLDGSVDSLGDKGMSVGLLFYLKTLPDLVGWPALLTALGTLPLLIKRVRQGHARLLPLLVLGLWLVAGVLWYAKTVSREWRYLLPLLPTLPMLAALGLRQLPRRVFGVASALLILATALPTLYVAGAQLPEERSHNLLVPTHARNADPLLQAMEIPVVEALRELLRRDPRGSKAFLLFTGTEEQELMALVAPHFPGALLGSLHFDEIICSRWQTRGMTHRKVLLISRDALPGFHALWSEQVDHMQLRIYKVNPYRQIWGRCNFPWYKEFPAQEAQRRRNRRKRAK